MMNGTSLAGAQRAAQAQAVVLAEADVEHHEIDARALERALHAAAAAGRGDAISGSFQVAGERGARLAVFVDDQDVFLCSHQVFVRTIRVIATSRAKSSITASRYVP